MILFFIYYLWIILGILLFLFIKKCMMTENPYRKYKKEINENQYSIKFIGWAILAYFILLLIPILNIVTFIISLCYFFDTCYIKPSVINKFNNIIIVKILNKEY